MFNTESCYFLKSFRQFADTYFIFDQLNIFHLAHRCTDGFIQIGSFAVDQSVYGISHVADDAYILKFQEGLIAADQT